LPQEAPLLLLPQAFILGLLEVPLAGYWLAELAELTELTDKWLPLTAQASPLNFIRREAIKALRAWGGGAYRFLLILIPYGEAGKRGARFSIGIIPLRGSGKRGAHFSINISPTGKREKRRTFLYWYYSPAGKGIEVNRSAATHRRAFLFPDWLRRAPLRSGSPQGNNTDRR
jgi:hypothetical protein